MDLCVCVWLFAMTGGEAKEGKQASAGVSPLGSRQIGFHSAVRLFLSVSLQPSLSSSLPRISWSPPAHRPSFTRPRSFIFYFFSSLPPPPPRDTPPFLPTSPSFSAHRFISRSRAARSAPDLKRKGGEKMKRKEKKTSPSVAAVDESEFIQPNPGARCVYQWVR